MNYCVRFSRKFEYKEDIAEYKIVYKPKDDQLINFLNIYSDKRIIISLTVEDMMDIVTNKALEKYSAIEKKNFSFLLPAISDENKKIISLFVIEIKKNNIPFFFDDKVYSIDKVWELINLGVSDIYICGELGFELEQIANKIHEAGVKIRVFPDIAQSTVASCESLTKFYIRPEDTQYYEGIVDIFEFFANDKNRDNVMYRIYEINRKWSRALKDIILEFEDDISNLSIPNGFGAARVHCNKKCLKNGKCKICYRAAELSNLLAENKLHLTNTNITGDEFDD